MKINMVADGNGRRAVYKGKGGILAYKKEVI